MDAARVVVDQVASDFGERFGRRKVGALDLAGDPDADTALVTIGSIGDTALELLGESEADDVLLVRVHAYRPFPVERLTAALARASRVAVVDRAPAFGSFGPLGADVRSLDLPRAQVVTNVVAGLGGAQVTPRTLRWVLERARSTDPVSAGRAPIEVPEGVH
jgi:pyruvate ferredoxin oxidoreductase alpha subunit